MRKSTLIIVYVLISLSVFAQTNQYNPSLSPLIRNDASTQLGKGEYFSADIYNPTDFSVNPAVSAFVRGVNVQYNFVDYNYLKDSPSFQFDFWKTRSFGVSYGNELLSGSFLYNEFGYATTSYFADNSIQAKYNTKMYALSLGRNVIDNLNAGISIKAFQINDEEYSLGGSNLTMFYDLGAVYTFINPFGIPSHSLDQLNVALSIVNLGDPNVRLNIDEDNSIYSEYKVPTYLNAGFSFALHFLSGETEAVRTVLHFNFRKYLDKEDWEEDGTTNISAGADVRIFKLVTLRGGFFRPSYEDFVYNQKDKFNFRFGAGVDISAQLFGIEIPVYVQVNYAYLPLYTDDLFFIQGTEIEDYTNAFGIKVQYMLK